MPKKFNLFKSKYFKMPDGAQAGNNLFDQNWLSSMNKPVLNPATGMDGIFGASSANLSRQIPPAIDFSALSLSPNMSRAQPTQNFTPMRIPTVVANPLLLKDKSKLPIGNQPYPDYFQRLKENLRLGVPTQPTQQLTGAAAREADFKTWQENLPVGSGGFNVGFYRSSDVDNKGAFEKGIVGDKWIFKDGVTYRVGGGRGGRGGGGGRQIDRTAASQMNVGWRLGSG